MKNILLFFIICISANALAGERPPLKSIVVKKVNEQIKIDGILDEDLWSRISPGTDFWQYFPSDSSLAKSQTEIYMAYDDQNLYVGIKCYSLGNKWIVNSLKRDFRAGGNDNITLVFDTFGDKTNGIFFGINPEGVIREGVITNGGNGFRDFSESWDNKWNGAAHKYEDVYTAELEIPFSTLRYDAKNQKWGFLAYRFDTQGNEQSVWNNIPLNQTLFSMAYAGDMIWEEGVPPSGNNVSLIPYSIGGVAKDYESATDATSDFDIGGDAKIAVTSGLNLDVTANPDFSQVEVDRQITNLSRFEIFFPERRQFFLENADLFGDFGTNDINPFFSRRIGVGIDQTTGTNVQNRIIGGARLSGKIDKNTRVGLLNMQTAENMERGLPSINYTVGVLQRKVLSRSNFGLIAVNKQSFGDNLSELGLNSYNRVFGGDFNYSSADNTWSGKTFLHHSVTSSGEGGKSVHGAIMQYSKRAFGATWSHDFVQDGYNAEVGFIRRSNYWRINPGFEFRFYPQTDFVNDVAAGIDAEIYWQPGFGKTDHQISAKIDGQLTDGSRYSFSVSHNYVYLFKDFDPTGTDGEDLKAGTSYNYVSLDGFIFSDRRKKLSYFLRPYVGSYFNGFRLGLSGSFTYTYQPKGSISLNYTINHFAMPHLDEKKHTVLIGPRIDYTFSKSLFLTTFVQYNSQSLNTNINTRLQWRFAPVSDFFLVYTDNYFTGYMDDPQRRFGFDIRNRAVVAKLTYWLNI